MKRSLVIAATLIACFAMPAIADQGSRIQLVVQSQSSSKDAKDGSANGSPNVQVKRTIDDWTKMIEDAPTRPDLYKFRGDAFARHGEFDKAAADYTKAIELDPRAGIAYACRGDALIQQREYARAKSDYETALKLLPADSPQAKKAVPCNLAWLLATSPEEDVRNGARALKLARKACEEFKWKEPNALDTLAAAYAETGDFRNAIKWETQAVKLAEGNKELQTDAEKRLALYKKGKPYRETSMAK
jgi:serine/threonine-protein kinase